MTIFLTFITFPCPCAVYMYKIMIFLNNSSETNWPISTKFHIDPTAEMLFRVCSNDHAPLNVMSKTKNCFNDDPFISCNDRIGRMLHNICISAVAMLLRWSSHGPWASCFKFCWFSSCDLKMCTWVWVFDLDIFDSVIPISHFIWSTTSGNCTCAPSRDSDQHVLSYSLARGYKTFFHAQLSWAWNFSC